MSYTWPARLSLYCAADVQIQQRGLFVVGSPSVVAAAMVGHGFARARGNRRAQRMAAPQWRKAGDGHVTLDEVGIKVIAPGAFEDVFVGYRTTTSWNPTRTGLEIQRAGWAALRIDTPDAQNLQAWLAHLSHGKTWPPSPHPLARLSSR